MEVSRIFIADKCWQLSAILGLRLESCATVTNSLRNMRWESHHAARVGFAQRCNAALEACPISMSSKTYCKLEYGTFRVRQQK